MRVSVLILAVLAPLTPALTADTLPLEVRLRAPKLPEGQPATIVEVEVRNASGDQAVAVAKTGTPLEGILTEDLFDVRRNDVAVPFKRVAFKRPESTADDYVVIGPRRRATATVDLSFVYDMTAAGTYSVEFKGPLTGTVVGAGAKALSFAALEGKTVTFAAKSKPITLSVKAQKRAPGAGPFIAPLDLKQQHSCSDQQLKEIADAEAERRRLVTNVSSYMASIAADGNRFEEWFGDHTGTPAIAAITTHFTAIGQATVGYNCPASCGTDASGNEVAVYAFVHPDDPGEGIYFCSRFWKALLTGRDSRAGTLVHELSHFTSVADTDDIAYGTAACRDLAKYQARAIRNADSHEYIAESADGPLPKMAPAPAPATGR